MKKGYGTINEALEDHASAAPQRTAIYYDSRIIPYGALLEGVNRMGNVLKMKGIAAGERVVMALPDCPEFFYCFLGAMKAGAWPVPLNPAMHRETFEFVLKDTEAAALITIADSQAAGAPSEHLKERMIVGGEEFQGLLEGASPELAHAPFHEDDMAFMLYSSGSTGLPKGVPHRHSDILFTARTFGKHVAGFTADDISLSASKLFFAYGLGNSLSFPLTYGASVVLYRDKATPRELFRLIREYRPTLFFAVPSAYSMMLGIIDSSCTTDSLRSCFSAGEALPAPLYHEWKKYTSLDILDGIGSTEALHIFISNIKEKVVPGSSGYIIPGYEARIVDEKGRAVEPGQEGHLQVRGASTAPHYWNRPEKTAETMGADGWLNTGDIFVEEGGCYRYQGRNDDMFKVDANWVSPLQIESTLKEHGAVLDCGVTWRTLGGLVKPVAFVVLKDRSSASPALARELRSHVLAKLLDYMCPVQFEFVEDLPRTDTGKLQRFRLRELLPFPGTRSSDA
ncbi:MAG: benzoate-CoA ligase family protein [Candidatus Eremiobacteraeota bacterium]|nr:benzoate-CoA ligase family protein [Candidatus Eremiobacteraeota bacterium]